MHLLKALRCVSYIESSELREAVFLDIVQRSASIRLVLRVHQFCRKLGIAHFLIGAYGLSYFVRCVLPAAKVRCLGVAMYPNEVKQLNELEQIMGVDFGLARVGWKLMNIQGLIAMLRWRRLRTIIRLARHIESRHRFMPACRVMASLFLYVRFRVWLRQYPVSAVVVTSDYSPDGAALAAAAGAAGIARIYIPHALPNFYFSKRRLFAYELMVLDSEAMHVRFARMDNIQRKAVYRGLRGVQEPMRLEGLSSLELRVGIFLSATHMPGLRSAVVQLVQGDVGSVLVRGHPIDFSNPDFSALPMISPKVHVSHGTTLLEDTMACDVIIAGDTTAILECLRFGAPVVYLSTLDLLPYDYNGFVEDGLVPEIDNCVTLDIAAIAQFYSGGWQERMCYFDAAYGRDEAVLHMHVRDAVLEILGRGA